MGISDKCADDDDMNLGLRGGERCHEPLPTHLPNRNDIPIINGQEFCEWYNTWRCNSFIPTLLTPKQLHKLGKLLRKSKPTRSKPTALGKRTRGKLTLTQRKNKKAKSTGGLAPRKQLWNRF